MYSKEFILALVTSKLTDLIKDMPSVGHNSEYNEGFYKGKLIAYQDILNHFLEIK